MKTTVHQKDTKATKADLECRLISAYSALGGNIASVAYCLLKARQAMRRYPSDQNKGELSGLRLALAGLKGTLRGMRPEERREVIRSAKRSAFYSLRWQPGMTFNEGAVEMKEAA
jgi:hypothetical protein